MATSLAQNKTLMRLELGSDSLTKYEDAKLFTQHLMLGAAGSITLIEVCIGFSSWWRDCHIQSECHRRYTSIYIMQARCIRYIIIFVHSPQSMAMAAKGRVPQALHEHFGVTTCILHCTALSRLCLNLIIPYMH